MKRVLACHDGSATASEGLLDYVRAQEGPIDLTIFHVLEPFPPILLEHEGSEDPEEEEALEARMEERRREWAMERLEQMNRDLQPLLQRVKSAGRRAGVSSLKIVPSHLPDDLVPLLKLELSSQGYDEVLIVHHAESWLKNFLNRTTAARIRKELDEVRVRIVRCSEDTGQCEL